MLRQLTAILIVMLAIGATITHGQQCPSNFCGGDTTQTCCSLTQMNSTTVQASCCAASSSCCLENHCCPSDYPVCCAEGQCCPQGRFCCVVDGTYKCCSMLKTHGNTDSAYATDPQPAQSSARNLVKK